MLMLFFSVVANIRRFYGTYKPSTFVVPYYPAYNPILTKKFTIDLSKVNVYMRGYWVGWVYSFRFYC